MRNIINKITLPVLCCFIASLLFIACDNDVEAIDFESPKVEHQNPELYEKYLEDLKKYKESDHSVVYAWLENDNSKLPTTHSLRMTVLPDSIDYIVLRQSSNLADWELEEMDAVREKGTKVLSSLDFDAIKLEYDTRIASLIEAGVDISNEPEFIDVLIENIKDGLSATDKYKFDGLVFGYNGKGIDYMTEKEKVQYLQYHNTFTRLVLIWKENNPDKTLTLVGKPQNILNKSILESCKHIVISTSTARNFNAVTFDVIKAAEEGVPTDRFIVTAETTSLDKDDTTTGFWSNGDKAIPSVANWVDSSHKGFDVIGIGIYEVSRDYYNPSLVFPTVRNAIQILNPSLKTE